MADETKNGVNPNQNLDPKQTINPVTQNKPEEEKKQDVLVQEFGFAEFKEAASRIIALPNVNNILTKCKGKIDDNLLKDIFDHNPIGENESLEAYEASYEEVQAHGYSLVDFVN